MSDKKVPSEEFLEAFSDHCGTCVATCECCGRVLFNSWDTGSFDDDELKRLNDKSLMEPEKYIDVDFGISLGSIDGKRFIYGCPCEMESLYKYEAFVWGNRRFIIEYLKKRITQNKEDADREYNFLKPLDGEVK
jgi:hypothetical protein